MTTQEELKEIKLTDAQKEVLKKYAEMSQKVSTATESPNGIDREKVLELTEGHRTVLGLPPAKRVVYYDSPVQAIKAERKLGNDIDHNNAFYGSMDAHWLYFYAFFRVEMGMTAETDCIRYLLELSKVAGWFWMDTENTIISARPAKIELLRKANGQLVPHCTTGKAIEYSDGEGLYALNGLTIPDEFNWVIADEVKDPEKILGIKNTEVRNEAMKLIDLQNNKHLLKGKLLDQKSYPTQGGDYELWELQVGGNRRVYLEMACPSSKKAAFEAVPPELKTVDEALHWREWGRIQIPGLQGYLPPVART